MHRTTIMLPPQLKSSAMHQARKLGLSLGELVRESLKFFLGTQQEQNKTDSLFSDDAVYAGPAPRDASQKADDYLYGEDL